MTRVRQRVVPPHIRGDLSGHLNAFTGADLAPLQRLYRPTVGGW